MATIVVLACLAAGEVEATPVRFAMTGTVTAHNVFLDQFGSYPPALGSQISGAYAMDLQSPGVTDNCPGFAECLAYTALSFEWGGVPQTPLDASSIKVRLKNNAPGTGPDVFEVSFVSSNLLNVTLTLTDATGRAFEAAADPLVPSLAAFDSATFKYTPFCLGGTSCIGNRWYSGTIDALAVTFGPTLATINPDAMYPNSAGNVTLTGTHFVSGATNVAVSGLGVTVSNVQVVNSGQLTATFTVAASTVTGSRNVTVTTSGGKSNAITFAIGALPPCSIAMDKPSFVNGDQVVAQVLQFGNSTANGLAVEFKLWLSIPGAAPGVIARGGADGSFVLPANLSTNVGPVTLFTVTSGLPRGTYSMNCRFLNPGTGAELAAGAGQFTLQ